MVKISPSILSCDFMRLGEEIKSVEKEIDMIHFDVMDGHFVPNITVGLPVLESLRKITKLPIEAHLMIDNPEEFIESFAKAGADIISVHIEAINNPKKIIKMIQKSGKKACLVISPQTSVNKVIPHLKDLYMVLVMSVNPGFGGQSFIDTTGKIKQLREYIDKNSLTTLIEIDGGINETTAKKAVDAGVDILVAGSYIYKSNNYLKQIEKLK